MDYEQEVVVDPAPIAVSNPITDAKPESIEVEGEEEGKVVPKPDPIPKGVQKRIDRAVRDKYEAEARSRALEERIAAMEQRQYQQPQPRQQDTAEPTIDKFENFDEYVAAKAAYIAKQQIESTLSAREQRQEAERQAAEQSKIADSWGKRVMQATAEMPDFEDVLSSSDLPMTGVMRQAIMESDVGPKLAYYLATHPEETAQISAMSGTGAVRALGRIEERLASQKPVVKTTNAPAPVVPVGTRSTVKKDPGKMSDAEYAKWRKSA